MSLNTIRNREESLGGKLIMFSKTLVPKNIERERSLCAGNELEDPQEDGAVCQQHHPSHQGQHRADVFCARHQENP